MIFVTLLGQLRVLEMPYILSPGNAEAMEGGIKYGPFNDSPDTIHKNQYSSCIHVLSFVVAVMMCLTPETISLSSRLIPSVAKALTTQQIPKQPYTVRIVTRGSDRVSPVRQHRGDQITPVFASPAIMSGKKRPIYGRTILSECYSNLPAAKL